MADLKLLALDFGASNGRGILGSFDGKRVALSELHRFENNYVPLNSVLYWDILRLYADAHACFACAAREGVELDAFGIDTWGVDYGLLDRNGALLSGVISYRHATDQDMPPVWDVVDQQTLFSRTGCAHYGFNTLYQLYRRKHGGDVALEQAKTLLMLPDLIGYFLTGEIGTEYTNATTSMLFNPTLGDWDYQSIDALGLPHIFTQIQRPGTLRGQLQQSVASELGLGHVPFAVVGEHDTASAVAAIPGEGSFAFCSSGTWSLFGVETDAPVITEAVRIANFSNEGTVQGGFRPLRNIMGLWLIQECRREWHRQGHMLSWDDIVRAAECAQPLKSVIDPDDQAFFSGGDMIGKIQRFCKTTAQPVPESVGEIARCVYESLALKYRWALARLEEIKGAPIDALNIVGGGIQNKLLNQMVADSIGRPVITGPIEGAAMGNILMQAVALKELSGIDDVRAVVRNSIDIEQYSPHHSQAWDDAYHKLFV